MNKTSLLEFREQFPILSTHVNGKALIYFDNAATTQKPAMMLSCYQQYYQSQNANVHRASHALSAKATNAYEQARLAVKHLINANTLAEIIWTKGSTESINLIAESWGRANLNADDEIVLSYSEHHANIVPWQILAEQTGAIIRVLPLNKQGVIDESQLEQVIGNKTKIVCVSHISNVLGRLNPVEKIIQIAKKHDALTLIDGAQAIAHIALDVSVLDCDFYVFSAHKIYGPTGVGVLYGREALLQNMPPYQAGGEMIKTVSFQQTEYNELPHKFEAGTPNIAGIISFSSTLHFIEQQNSQRLFAYEKLLRDYCYQQLSNLDGIAFIVDGMPDIPLFSFNIKGHHHHDLAATLDSQGIAVRAGHHCAMPLMEYLHIDGCIRVSLSAYNTFEEVDQLVATLKAVINSETIFKQTDVMCKPLALANEQTAFPAIDEILSRLQKAKGWDSKHREIMLLGKKHIPLADDLKNERSLIAGCESKAWLICRQNTSGKYQFTADSNAKIIRGLLTIVLAAVNNKTADEITAFNMKSYFQELGLEQHLSPSRSNGLHAIVKKIYQLCETLTE